MEEKKRLLVTGGCGFIGHHFIEHILKNTNWDIVVIDKLNYASEGFDRLRDINAFDEKRVLILAADFTKKTTLGLKKEIGDVNYIIHMGAETHVDNSITDPEPFVYSNVVGTMRILDLAKQLKSLEKFIYFSTDEVYGPAPEGVNYKETDRLNSTNPYSASKAGAEQLCQAYANCYNIPVIVTNTMNVFGERQHFEKFIPGTIRKVLLGEKVIIHSDSKKEKAGSRFYIHARNVSSAILNIIKTINPEKDKYYFENGLPQFKHRYNIVGEKEMDNLELAKFIADVVGKVLNEKDKGTNPLKYELTDFHSARPGHDLRYALDGSKLKEMGFEYPKTFEESLTKTVEWFLKDKNKRWLGLDQK